MKIGLNYPVVFGRVGSVRGLGVMELHVRHECLIARISLMKPSEKYNV